MSELSREQLNKLDLEYMTDELYAYKTLDELRDIFGYNRETIRKYALKKGWDQDWRWNFRWKEDEDILGEDDYSYYFLGYFLGDGSLEERNEKHRNRYGITVYSTETHVLSKMRDFLRIDNIKMRERISTKGWTREYRIDKNSKPIYEWLLNKGITSNKSVVDIDIIYNINREYLYSFLRGLMDSDGNVFFDKKSSSRAVSWYGSRECMAGVCAALLEEGFNVKYHKHESVYVVKVTNAEDIKELYQRMYISDMYIPRKKYIIEEMIHNVKGRKREYEFHSYMRPYNWR